MPIAKLRQEKRQDPLFPIIFSVIIASVLMVYPLAYAVSGWRPLFMMMVMQLLHTVLHYLLVLLWMVLHWLLILLM